MSWHASIILIPLWLLLATHGASSVAEKNEDEDLIKQGGNKRDPRLVNQKTSIRNTQTRRLDPGQVLVGLSNSLFRSDLFAVSQLLSLLPPVDTRIRREDGNSAR